MFLICIASIICSFCLLFWCSNIVVLSVRIFRTSVVEHEWFCAIELVSERCIVYHFCGFPPLMMAQNRTESTWDIFNYEKYINQFPPNTIKEIRQYKRINKKICEQYWTSPGGNTPQGSIYTATSLPSRKLYKLDEPDTQDTAWEARTHSSVMYSYGPPHMVKQKQEDQLEHTAAMWGYGM